MVRGKVFGAPWSCFMHPTEPKGPQSSPCACPGETLLLPHHTSHHRLHFLKSTLLYEQPVSAIFNVYSMNNKQETITVLNYSKAEYAQASELFWASFSPVWICWKNIGNFNCEVHFLNHHLPSRSQTCIPDLSAFFCILNQLFLIWQFFSLDN